MQDTLSERIWSAKHESNHAPQSLTDQEKADILDMVGNRCRAETKRKLARKIDLPLSLWNSFGIYGRVYFEKGKAGYIPCQDYTYEMRTIRECILNH